MARRVLDAMDYTFRKVIRVVMDDSIPAFIHPEDSGVPHEPGLARGPALPDGSRGPLDSSLAAGTECHACVSNWIVEEFIFQDDALRMTDREMMDYITTTLDQRAGAPVRLVDLNGRPI